MRRNKILTSLLSPISILIFIGLLLRIAMFFAFQPFNHIDEVITSDAEGYHKLAIQLLQNHSFVVPGTDLDTFRTPGYPVFISCIYSIFGINASAVLFIQIFLNLGSVLLLYYIGKSLINKSFGFIAALLLCIEPDHLLNIFYLLTDTLFVFIFLLSCLFLILFVRKNKTIYVVLSAAVLGLATLVRPISFLFPLVLISGLVVYLALYKKSSIILIAKNSLLVLFTFGLTISPWLIRNYEMYGYSKLSSISGYNLLNYNVAFSVKKAEKKQIDIIRNDFDSIVNKRATREQLNNPFYKSDVQAEVAKDYIKKHKKEYIKSHCLGMLNIYSSMDFKTFSRRILRIGDDVSQKYNGGSFDKFAINIHRFKTLPFSTLFIGGIYSLLLFLYYTTAILGSFLFFREKRYLLLFYIVTCILYFTLLIGVVGLARYKLSISPFYIFLSAYGIYYIINWHRQFKTDQCPSDIY
jgi:4-amino-4-deoxy-L-arabinose transferase-like glycosyltransferase